MQGNKNPSYSFKENEAGDYHLRMTFQIHIPQEKRYESNVRTVKVSIKDFAAYRNPETQKVIGWTELEILHDPTFTRPIPVQPVKQADAAEIKEIPVEEPQAIKPNEPIKVKPKQRPKSRHK